MANLRLAKRMANFKRNQKFKLVVSLILFIAFAAFAYRASVFRITKNLSTVDEGKLYRSAQLTTPELEEIIATYHIKTVISLRGAPGRTYFYEPEADTLQRLNVQFIPVTLEDEYYPHEKDLKEIFHQFDHGQYPILIHCRVGADRTGLVAALYQRAYMNKSLKESRQQLSFKNWHVPFLKPAMTQFLEKFKGVQWVMTEYHVCSPEFDDYRENDDVCKK